MRLKLSTLALEDLSLIHDYTLAEWGEAQTVRYVNALWDALEVISTTPCRWRLRPEIYPECRARSCGSHLIIYRVRTGCVEISRILHGAMNLREKVPENFMGEGE